ncbi:hypothetical protein [Pseudalkalibacillus caeni]|uniref:Uncharacterized protein n=1 Tax=Exobacillus caeni TaxID=2574798 RepID=A0A5R9EYN4_9BACL|nr:hypothetical protein [Pseudalkalibacillus caeni]TLS36277.1 hypothetical protein FCL54_16725 [Pseudalkalibacillus caeni]
MVRQLEGQRIVVDSHWLKENAYMTYAALYLLAREFASEEKNGMIVRKFSRWKEEGFLIRFNFNEDGVIISAFETNEENPQNPWLIDSYDKIEEYSHLYEEFQQITELSTKGNQCNFFIENGNRRK